MSSIPPAPVSLETLRKFLVAIGSVERWQILQELAKGEALPVRMLAKRIGIPETNVSKLMVSLRESGIAERTPSRAYRIHPQFTVPGEQAVDLGVMLLRLDRVSPQ
jgi:DNA-binding IclR family transcriptional regulator